MASSEVQLHLFHLREAVRHLREARVVFMEMEDEAARLLVRNDNPGPNDLRAYTTPSLSRVLVEDLIHRTEVIIHQTEVIIQKNEALDKQDQTLQG